MSAHVAGSNRAQHIRDGVILVATEMRRYGYGDGHNDPWICPDCGVKVQPRASKEFRKDGTKFRRTAHFWAPEGHVLGCPNDASAKNKQQGDGIDHRLPTEFVSHLILEATQPLRELRNEASLLLSEPFDEIRSTRDETDAHLRSERHIRPACLDYAASADNHERFLKIDRSERRAYRDWFVRLGTGGQEVLHSPKIFYDQIQFTASIDWSSTRVVIPLFSWVGRSNRRLVIDMSEWPDGYKHSLRGEIEDAMTEGAQAWRLRNAARPWIFFFGQEHSLDQVDYHVDLEARVCAFTCIMPEQRRAFRPRFNGSYPNVVSSFVNEDVQTPGVDPQAAAAESAASEPQITQTSDPSASLIDEVGHDEPLDSPGEVDDTPVDDASTHTILVALPLAEHGSDLIQLTEPAESVTPAVAGDEYGPRAVPRPRRSAWLSTGVATVSDAFRKLMAWRQRHR